MRRVLASVLLAAACTQPSLPSPSSTSTPATEPSATVAATSLPTSSPTNPFGIVQAFPLGALRGDWVFALRESQIPIDASVLVELLAMPLAESGTPRVVVSFQQPPGGVNLPLPNGIGGQLSPDGRSIVLGVDGRTRGGDLAVVDLERGTVRLLGEGVLPVWGSSQRIAFQRRHPTDVYGVGTSWLIDPAGGAVTRIPDDAAPLAWHRNTLAVRVRDGIELRVPAESQNGLRFPMMVDNVPVGERPISTLVQSGVTVLAVPTSEGSDTAQVHRIEVLSTPGAGSRQTVAAEVGSYVEVRFAEPRWNPHPEVLQIIYRREGSRRRELHIVDVQSGRDVAATTAGVARRAEWTPDGEQIVYTTDLRLADGPATQVRATRPLSGRDDRLLMSTEPGVRVSSFRDVATVRYAAP
jgi:hypothetical protein